MKVKLEGGAKEGGLWFLNFDLVDDKGNIHSSHEYETSGGLETDMPLDVYSNGLPIRLVPKIKKYRGKLTLDGRYFTDAIDARAREIGYPITGDPLYP
jgi:hypothetical protein